MDMTETIAPKSDQLNADDLMTGPRTFTIEKVSRGTAEQPVDVHLVEFPGRPFKPSKSMRRVMVAAWGSNAANYSGQRLTLYRDAEITFGRDKVGGIRISHMSGIDKALTLALTVTRGKRSPYVVKPLADEPAAIKPADKPASDNAARIAELRAEWKTADDERRLDIEADVARLSEQP
jgi:hypothetical protein